MKRISLYVVAMLAMVAIMVLPAIAHDNPSDDNDRYDYNKPYDDSGSNSYDDDDDDYGYNDDDYDRYPPGYNDREEEPRAPECDWYGPYHERPWDPWYEYWCYWHGWGWEYVFWVYA